MNRESKGNYISTKYIKYLKEKQNGKIRSNN